MPGAHRAHIALEELKIPFEEVIIDLATPRTPEYLKINPRGLVPALSYNGEIIVESAIVSQFLADAYPSHLVPPSNAPDGALRRARIALFVDAFISKFNGPLLGLYTAKTDEDRNAIAEKALVGIVKEVEPLLADASPFFGGSDKLTLAEVRETREETSRGCSDMIPGPDWLVGHPVQDSDQGRSASQLTLVVGGRKGAQLHQVG